MKGTDRGIKRNADQPKAVTPQREEQPAHDRAREWLRRIHAGGSLALAEYVRAEEILAALSRQRRGRLSTWMRFVEGASRYRCARGRCRS